MTADSPKPESPLAPLLRQTCAMIDLCRQTAGLLDDARAANADLLNALENTTSTELQRPVETSREPSPATETLAERRRMHRTGTPSRIQTDPELQAFIRARIDTLTFGQIADEIAEAFPPERRVSRSSPHRWFHQHASPRRTPQSRAISQS